MKANKLVVIDWRDAYTAVGWDDEIPNTISIVSVGWLRYEDEDKVVLVGMKGSDESVGYNCKQSIPKGCIQSIRVVEDELPKVQV